MRKSNQTLTFLAIWIATAMADPSTASAQEAGKQQNGELHADPATGIVYRKQVRQVQRPIVETQMRTRQQTVYMPKTVVETKPVTRTAFVPVTRFKWEPRVEGRWNPFRQPTVAYRHVPETRWESRSEVVQQTETKVKWEPETKMVQIPERMTRMQNDQIVQYEAIGQLAPQTAMASAPSSTNLRPDIASRLRPIHGNVPMQPITTGGDRSLASGAGSLATRERTRSTLQSGLRATELAPSGPSLYGTPGAGASNVAGLPGLRIWR